MVPEPTFISDPIAEVAAKARAASTRVYKDKNILVGAILGGPLIIGYMLASNFKALGDSQGSTNTWRFTIPLTVLLFTLIIVLPEELDPPSYLFVIFYVLVANFLVKKYQSQQLKEHYARGGLVHSWGRVVVVGLIGTFLTFAVLFLLIFSFVILTDPEGLEEMLGL